MKTLVIFIALSIPFLSTAQYTSPNTGVVWNMDSLVIHSQGVVIEDIENNYIISNDLFIEDNDVLAISSAISITIDPDVLITIRGSLLIVDPLLTIKSTDENNNYSGIRCEQGSNIVISNCNLEYGGGIKVLTEDFTISNCSIQHFSSGVNTGAAIELSHGKPQIFNNTFIENDLSAVSSAANASVAPIISGNTIQNNVASNVNRPQINMGPSGASDTTLIVNNTIIGSSDYEMAGGIASSSLIGGISNVIISDNSIENNRYGIAILGNGITALIDNNTIDNNKTQNNPMLGGSGINLNSTGSSTAIISNNTITNNLWGVTIQGEFEVNLGDDSLGDSPGHNTFNANENGGEVFALYNNTPNEISAMNNCWSTEPQSTLEYAEEVIYHQEDDTSLGLVIFDPIWDCTVSIPEDDTFKDISLYPNPSQGVFYIDIHTDIDIINTKVYSIYGALLDADIEIKDSKISIDIDGNSPGMYIITLESNQGNINIPAIISNTYPK